MIALGSLWLPILIATVLVFLASFVMWMVLPHHRTDWGKLPDEEGFRAAVNGMKVGQGMYVFPHIQTPKEMSSPEWQKKMAEGPVGYLTLKPTGNPNMAKSLTVSFVYNLIVSFVIAYITSRTVPATAEYLTVFRVSGTAAVLAYCGALFWQPIWMGKSWSSTIKDCFDGVVYGLLTAGAFAGFWPA